MIMTPLSCAELTAGPCERAHPTAQRTSWLYVPKFNSRFQTLLNSFLFSFCSPLLPQDGVPGVCLSHARYPILTHGSHICPCLYVYALLNRLNKYLCSFYVADVCDYQGFLLLTDQRLQESSERLDKWFANQSKETSFDDTFTPDVAVLRHITDFETGKRSTVCYGPETLQKQTWNFFGQRTKHLLAEVVIPEQYMTFVQSYEVTKEADGRQWRQSSLRIRVLDPNQSYKLRLGMIFYSERDCLPPRMLKGGGQLQGNVAKTHSSCLGPRPSMQLPQNPASAATAGNQNLRPASENLQGPSPSKRIKRIPNTEAVAS